MVGVIRTWDILAHPLITVRCFGWGVFFQAIGPWQQGTFLSLLQKSGALGGPQRQGPEILDRCIRLELRAKELYLTLADKLGGEPMLGPFFAGLAEQEQYHADLLETARMAAVRCGWTAQYFNPWQDYLPRLEQQMDAAEAAVSEIQCATDALLLAIHIEASEVNEVFHAALAATDAAFVKRLRPFREAMEAHMSYLVERIPELAPELLLATRELRARYPRVRTE
jgi:hypothetical protein